MTLRWAVRKAVAIEWMHGGLEVRRRQRFGDPSGSNFGLITPVEPLTMSIAPTAGI